MSQSIIGAIQFGLNSVAGFNETATTFMTTSLVAAAGKVEGLPSSLKALVSNVVVYIYPALLICVIYTYSYT